ncbi:MAG TPA: FHA domain-containing protein, partial [Candidatus Acidoferrales bacterium]|nr:FHA domain-containing protein [Candidatus Acidoferrales bacterium]
MAKLVVLTQSMAGRSCDLASERTTIGRVEENNFQISEPSVSSRHCEILLRGNDIVVRDLGSTNGTFINGEKITGEGVLKPGQTLRLGNVELKLDAPGAPGAPAPASGSAPAPAPATPPKKEAAKPVTGGVRMSDLEGGGRTVAIDTSVFTKKKPSKNLYFWIGVGVAILVIIILILVLIEKVTSGSGST